MVERDHDHILRFGQLFPVIRIVLNPGACGIPAAMEPHHDRTLCVLIQALRPDVQVLAVLMLGIEDMRHGKLVMRDRRCDFRADKPVDDGIPDAFPCFFRFRHMEAPCVRVPDAPENVRVLRFHAPELSQRRMRDGLVVIADHLLMQFFDEHNDLHS